MKNGGQQKCLDKILMDLHTHTHVAGIQNLRSAQVTSRARSTINIKEECWLKKYAQHSNPNQDERYIE